MKVNHAYWKTGKHLYCEIIYFLWGKFSLTPFLLLFHVDGLVFLWIYLYDKGINSDVS